MIRKAPLALGYVSELQASRARGAKLVLTTMRLVVDVSEAVLMEADALRCGPRMELSCEPRGECPGNHREVDG
jgi:hypothetical protein